MLAFHTQGIIEAGCDEAGRGCLAGPVFASAVILPSDYSNDLLNDSKKLPEKKRVQLREIIQRDAIEWAIGVVSNQEIDEINILNASFLAMHRALEKLKTKPQSLLIDGNRFKKYKKTRHHCIIKGDGIYQSIAAASILAKTYRDDYMEELHLKFPEYGWLNNKGYPTLKHREAIKEFGETDHHRKTFRLLNEQLSLEL